MIKKDKKIKLSSQKVTTEDIRKLVLARIEASTGDLGIIVGSKKQNKSKIIESVKRGDEFGQRIIDAHMAFLRGIAEGKIYGNE